MINFIKKLFGWQDKCFGAVRSNKWPKLRKVFLKEHPYCEVCGNEKDVVPHHKTPVHVDQSKELKKDNLISLCERDKVLNCHLIFGHCGNFKKFNDEIDSDAQIWAEKLRSTALTSQFNKLL